MPRPTSAAEAAGAAAPILVTIVTMDTHLASATERAHRRLRTQLPGLQLTVHAAAQFASDDEALAACRADIHRADIVIASMLFLEDHFTPVLADLQARRERCDALLAIVSAPEVTRLTRLGRLDMSAPASGAMAWLKKLKPGAKRGADGKASTPAGAGAQQMTLLRRLPQLLRFVPGTAQDLRAYFLAMQYWLAGSEDNMASLVQHLIGRYADGPRRALREVVQAAAPVDYPDVGVYHPRLPGRIAASAQALPRAQAQAPSVRGPALVPGTRGTVGLLLLRSYLLAGNTGHYDGVITALEARGLRVVPAFASGLDARPAIEAFFMQDGRPVVDAVVSLTGFSLVGGPAYNDAPAAEAVLGQLDVPYLAVHAVEFQRLDQWGGSERGLLPVESTIMVAIPELDGGTGSMVFGGRGSGQIACTGCAHACRFDNVAGQSDMHACIERADTLAARVGKLIDLRRSERAERRIALVIFNFPPNAGATGSAAHLSVFESAYNTLAALQRQGYTVDLPPSVDALREAVIHGNATALGALANVHARIPVDEHVRRERHLAEIEAQWGPAPGRQLTDGRSLQVLGERFGNVFVGVQPAMGYEGDPMRLLFERGFAPTHAFSAFYRWLREDFRAHAVLHFGTHGALEFMPGKQAGMSARCWPDRLIGDLPNVYLYASNNPSEGTIAKRRAAATLVSYLTPPVAEAGLYKGLADLRALLDRYRGLAADGPAGSLEPAVAAEAAELAAMVQTQAAALSLCAAEPAWGDTAQAQVLRLTAQLLELEYTLIPQGLHVVGRPPVPAARVNMLRALAEASHGFTPSDALLQALVDGLPLAKALARSGEPADASRAEALKALANSAQLLAEDHELAGILRALDGRYLRPAPGGDLMRTPAVLPTGRNLHGFDPFRIPSAYALKDGARQAERLLEKHRADGHGFPASIAMVLWGTDNLKSEGGPIGQALALMGAAPRFDSYGRLAGARLLPLAELGRPRVDVVITLSGIFRDLLPLQVRLLAEAAFLAASAEDELPALNPIRRHALADMAAQGCDLETAALRVFGNAEGAYGANVGMLVDSSRWEDADELAETYSRRKGFAYGRAGRAVKQPALLQSTLSRVELAYQNLDSVELGVTTIDTYFDTLGGISRSIRRARRNAGGAEQAAAPVYIGDQTRDGLGGGMVRTLDEQVSLETRTRMLNPAWYEGLLAHGYEGVRQIEAHLTNTLGWSATTGAVQPWVYQQVVETFVLDPVMRERLASLNPAASAKLAQRLLEAQARQFWQPDDATLAALRDAGDELEDRLEGVFAPPSNPAAAAAPGTGTRPVSNASIPAWRAAA